MLDVAAPPTRLVSAFVPGPAGRLEALLRLPARPRGAAVVAHPHPLHGGTMHTKVVHRAARLLSDRFGFAALRFNFRGVGSSAGLYDEGRGEVDDLLAAADWIRRESPEGPLLVGGFSFGSVAAVEAARRRVPDTLFLIGLPLKRFGSPETISRVACPVVWIQGERDEFSDPEAARAVADRVGWDFTAIPGADHFFAGHLDAFEDAASAALARAFPARSA